VNDTPLPAASAAEAPNPTVNNTVRTTKAAQRAAVAA
jgi:hypothetical protein